MKTLLKRFSDKWGLVQSGCWEWTAATDGNGYGDIWKDGRLEKAHRVSYELFVGLIPKGMSVLHECDNPPCVNPRHLFLGSTQDNMDDRDAKGRQVALKGSQHGNSKLTEKDIPKIRSLLKAGNTQQDVADIMNVSRPTIGQVSRGVTWTQVRG